MSEHSEHEKLLKTVIRDHGKIVAQANKLKEAEKDDQPPKGEVFYSREPALNPNTIDPNRPLVSSGNRIPLQGEDPDTVKKLKEHDGQFRRLEARINNLDDGIQQILGVLRDGTYPVREPDPARPDGKGARPPDGKKEDASDNPGRVEETGQRDSVFVDEDGNPIIS